MDTADIRLAKQQAEKQVADILKILEQETGCAISSMKLTRSGVVRGSETPKITGVTITMEL